MDLRTQIQNFLQRYQTTGWLLMFMGIGFIVEILIILIVGGISGRETAFRVVDTFALPTNFMDLIYQPWSLFTYPFFPVLEGFRFFNLLITGLILWAFGRIHQQLLGDERTRRMIILAVPLIGLLTLSVTSTVGYYYNGEERALTNTTINNNASGSTGSQDSTLTEESGTSQVEAEDTSEVPGQRVGLKFLAYVSGMMPIVLLLVISCITLVPEYPIQLFLFGNVKIVYIGIILFILEWALAFFTTPLAISYLFGGLLGFGFVFSLRRGTDITEKVWNYYTGSSENRGQRKMEVKKNSSKPPSGQGSRSRRPSGDKKNSIPEELIDNILDKISASGYESLSREEKEMLYKASTQKEDEKRDKES